MLVTALIFDMDGVIVDSTAIHTQAWRVYLKEHGLVVENIQSRMLGKHNDELVRDFFPTQELTRELILEHGNRKEAVYRNLMSPILEQKLVPGIREFILRHCDRPLGVATNAEPGNLNFVLDARVFDAVSAQLWMAIRSPGPSRFRKFISRWRNNSDTRPPNAWCSRIRLPEFRRRAPLECEWSASRPHCSSSLM